MNRNIDFPRRFSMEGKEILVYSDGIIELNGGVYDKSLKGLYEAVKLSKRLRRNGVGK